MESSLTINRINYRFTYHEVIGSCTKKKGKKKLILAILLALMIIG